MKNLIKLSIIFCMLLVAVNGSCQIFGIRAGFNLVDMIGKDDADHFDDEWKMKPACHLGGIVRFPIDDMFSVETGILLTSRGLREKIEETDGPDSWEYKACVNLFYIEIPITAQVIFALNKKAKMFIAFGPYMGVGITGAVKDSYKEDSETDEDSRAIHWGNNEKEDDLKRFDAGLIFGAGVECKSFQFGTSYNLGLANVSAYTEDGYKMAHRVLSFYVTYLFGHVE